jgi:hypothetical protein
MCADSDTKAPIDVSDSRNEKLDGVVVSQVCDPLEMSNCEVSCCF